MWRMRIFISIRSQVGINGCSNPRHQMFRRIPILWGKSINYHLLSSSYESAYQKWKRAKNVLPPICLCLHAANSDFAHTGIWRYSDTSQHSIFIIFFILHLKLLKIQKKKKFFFFANTERHRGNRMKIHRGEKKYLHNKKREPMWNV